jgi:hypothetical protein
MKPRSNWELSGVRLLINFSLFAYSLFQSHETVSLILNRQVLRQSATSPVLWWIQNFLIRIRIRLSLWCRSGFFYILHLLYVHQVCFFELILNYWYHHSCWILWSWFSPHINWAYLVKICIRIFGLTSKCCEFGSGKNFAVSYPQQNVKILTTGSCEILISSKVITARLFTQYCGMQGNP